MYKTAAAAKQSSFIGAMTLAFFRLQYTTALSLYQHKSFALHLHKSNYFGLTHSNYNRSMKYELPLEYRCRYDTLSSQSEHIVFL